MDIKQCYSILVVDVGASLQEVKVAYRDLAQVWHPDRFQNSPRLQAKAAEQMKQINAAYEMLTKHLAAPRTTPTQAKRPSKPAHAEPVHSDWSTAQASFHAGKACYDARNYPEAISNFQTAIDLNPRYEEAYKHLAMSFSRCSRYEEGLAVWKKLLTINSNNASAYMGLAGIYKSYASQSETGGDDASRKRFLEQALAAYKQYVRLRSQEPDGHFSLGETHYQLGNFREAAESYKRVLKLDPISEGANFNLGCAYFSLGEYMLAIEFLQQGIRISRYNLSGSWTMLGRAFMKIGWIKQAVDAYKKAIHINSRDADAHSGLGEAYLATHNKAAVLEVVNVLKQLDAAKAEELYQQTFS